VRLASGLDIGALLSLVALFAVANPPFADRRRNLWFCEFDDWRLRNKTAVFQPKTEQHGHDGKSMAVSVSFDSNFAGPCLAPPKSGFTGSPTPLTFRFEQVTLPNHGAVARALLVHSVYWSGFLLCRVIRVRTTRLYQWVSEGIRPGKIVRREADGES
jgi:hypothetical protein